MKFVGLAAAFWIVSVSLCSSADYQEINDYPDITPEEVMSIAGSEKDGYVDRIDSDHAKVCQSGLRPDYPVRVNSMKFYDILTYRTGDDFYPMIKTTGEWFVPLSCDGEPFYCLSVGFADGKWQAVDINIFGDCGGTFDKNITSEFMPGTDGRKYVEINGGSIKFIAVPVGEETKLLPVTEFPYTSTADIFPPDKKDSQGLFSVSDVMPNIVSSVRGCMGISLYIRINDQIREVYQTDTRQSINITAELDDYWGYNDDSDCWIALEWNDKLYYLNSSMQWVVSMTPFAQSPLKSISVKSISGFSIYSGTLPAGTYKLYFGVDLTQDGIVNEPLFWWMTTITVQE